MRISRMNVGSEKEILAAKNTSQKMEKLGLISPRYGGKKIYSYPAMGTIVLRNLERTIRRELEAKGVFEMRLPVLQPVELWNKSGRLESFGSLVVYANGKNIGDKKYIVSPTNEEVVTQLAQREFGSHRKLPVEFYQFDNKVRDDGSSRKGIVRTDIFPVLESYSLNSSAESLDESARLFQGLFENVLNNVGVDFVRVNNKKGYVTLACLTEEGDKKLSSCECGFFPIGETEGISCENCGEDYSQINSLGIACIMGEGTFYSEKQKSFFVDENDGKRPFYLGTYGIGLTRVMHELVRQGQRKDFLYWKPDVRPFDVSVIPILEKDSVRNYSEEIYRMLSNKFNCVYEDTPLGTGSKIRRANYLGIPIKVIVGEKEFDAATVMLKGVKDYSYNLQGKEIRTGKLENYILKELDCLV